MGRGTTEEASGDLVEPDVAGDSVGVLDVGEATSGGHLLGEPFAAAAVQHVLLLRPSLYNERRLIYLMGRSVSENNI